MASTRFDEETSLVLMLSNPHLPPGDVDKIEDLCQAALDWNRVLGMLILHRTVGQAWVNLTENGLVAQAKLRAYAAVPVLQGLFKSQEIYVREQIDHNVELIGRFEAAGVRSLLMKGAAIARMGYARLGVRTFADNDFLFDRDDIALVGAILKEIGYIQGDWDPRTGTVTAASRSDVLLHPLTSHETYPYVRPTPGAAILEGHCVDVHFSVDLMTSNRNDEAVRDLMARRVPVPGNEDGDMWALSREDMFVFLCVHYQREASHRREAMVLKDLVLYKIMDLVALLGDRAQPLDLDLVAERAASLGFGRETFYALSHLQELYPHQVPEGFTDSFRPSGPVDFLDQLMHNGEPVHRWTGSLAERFFTPQRISELIHG